MKKKNLKTNAILNVIKTSLAIVFPLITYPYALRTIGVAGLGKVSFASSIANYFALIAMLGVNTYGVREGAKLRDDYNDMSKFVSEIFSINIISTIISCLCVLCITGFTAKLRDYRLLILVQSTSFVFTTLGMDWINTVYEDFKRITIRSIITYSLSLVLLFVFIKTPNDYFKYALLVPLTNLIICVSNAVYIHRRTKVKLILSHELIKHVKPLLILFTNTVAITIYVNVDNTMLGWLKGDYDLGLYVIPVRIYHTMKTILVAIYTVTIPRLSVYIGEENFILYKKTFSSLCSYIATLLIPACVGLACVSNELLFCLGGNDANGGTLALQILAGSLLFAIFGGLITAVFNITIDKEKDNLIATVISAVINLVLNFIFIPLFSLNGAAFTTLISELFVFVFCLYRNKDVYGLVDFKRIIQSILQAIIGSLAIIVIAVITKMLISGQLVRLIIIVPTSVLIYGLLLLLMKNEFACWGLQIIRGRTRNLYEKIRR